MRNLLSSFSYLLILLSFSISTVAWARTEVNVTASTVQQLEETLKKAGIKRSPRDIQQMEELFHARTLAHRLRLSQLYVELSKDPDFRKQFPEFKPLTKDSEKTLKALLEHDASKVSTETKHAARVLSLLQGFDYRNPNKGLSPEVDEEIRKTLKAAIDDINRSDKQIMKAHFEAVSPNMKWTQAHETMTEALDFYDTYKFRQLELSKDGRKLTPPSEWISKLEAEGHYTEEEKQQNKLKKKFAKFLEEKDPLKNTWKFAKSEDFLGLKEKTSLNQAFHLRAQQLLDQVSTAKFMGIKGVIAGAAKSSAIGAGVLSAVSYAISPEETSAQSVTEALTTTSDTISACMTVRCRDYINQCAEILGLAKDTNYKRVLEHEKYGLCVDHFHKQPLHVQSKLREDPDVNRLLEGASPNVISLTCNKQDSNSRIEIITKTSKSPEFVPQTLYLNSKGEPEKLVKLGRDTSSQDRILYTDAKPMTLQSCGKTNDCKNFPMDEVRTTKLYFFRDDRVARLAGYNGKVYPIESFRWARQASNLTTKTESISSCCDDRACLSYFNKRAEDLSRAQKQIVGQK